MRMRASILVVNYHSEEDILAAAKVLIPLKESFEIIVIDNSLTFSEVPESLDDFMSVFPNPEGNSGFGRGMNYASERARAPLLCLLNPDVEMISPEILTTLVERLESSPPDVGSVGCQMHYSDGKAHPTAILSEAPGVLEFLKQQIRNSMPSRLRNTEECRKGVMIKSNDENNEKTVVGFYAAFVVVRTEAFRSVGGFDPDFFMYCEDTEFFRCRFSKNWRSVFYPDISVCHPTRKSDVHRLMEKQNMVSYLLYLRKISIMHLFVYSAIQIPRSIILLMFESRRKHGAKLLVSFSYLPQIFARGSQGSLRRPPLKIREIPD
ncbi:MAG: glycosyltransferase [Pseudomonadota bacterium]